MEIDELISRTPKLLNDKNKILNILLVTRNGIINEKYDYTFTFNDYFINNINSIELRFLTNNTDEFLELLNLEKIKIKSNFIFWYLHKGRKNISSFNSYEEYLKENEFVHLECKKLNKFADKFKILKNFPIILKISMEE